MITWTSDKRKLSELNPAPYNPRKLTEEQAKQLTQSLERFNLADPIVINLDNTIIGGHQRINIYKSQGKTDIEVDVRVPSRKLIPEEEKELNLRLNKNLGEWDFDLLANFDEDMLKDVGFTDIDFKIFDIEPLIDVNFEMTKKPQFQQITFTLHDSQVPIVKTAIDKAKKNGCDNCVNGNSNGNALEFICKRFSNGC